MEDLGFFYIEVHEAWFHTPTSNLIFMDEIFTRTDEELKMLVFERIGENPSDWLISNLKHPFDPPD